MERTAWRNAPDTGLIQFTADAKGAATAGKLRA
jgi:hypothetical protein